MCFRCHLCPCIFVLGYQGAATHWRCQNSPLWAVCPVWPNPVVVADSLKGHHEVSVSPCSSAQSLLWLCCPLWCVDIEVWVIYSKSENFLKSSFGRNSIFSLSLVLQCKQIIVPWHDHWCLCFGVRQELLDIPELVWYFVLNLCTWVFFLDFLRGGELRLKYICAMDASVFSRVDHASRVVTCS